MEGVAIHDIAVEEEQPLPQQDTGDATAEPSDAESSDGPVSWSPEQVQLFFAQLRSVWVLVQ